MPEEPVDLIFVYGTLRTEFATIGEKLCHDRVKAIMVDLGACPGVYPVDDQENEEFWVVGEVIQINPQILPLLDKYEGTSSGLYSRGRITTESGHECWIYIINPALLERGRFVESGDWFNREAHNGPGAIQIQVSK